MGVEKTINLTHSCAPIIKNEIVPIAGHVVDVGVEKQEIQEITVPNQKWKQNAVYVTKLINIDRKLCSYDHWLTRR